MSSLFASVLAAVGLALTAGGALAQTQGKTATLVVSDGDVFVNRGKGYFRAAVGQELKAGDRVMVGPTSEAKISYTSTCLERVRIGRVIVVSETPPCEIAGYETVAFDVPINAVGIGPGQIAGAMPGALIGGAGLAGIGNGIYKAVRMPSSP